MKKLAAGFTLIELLVVMAIITILSSFMLMNFNEVREESRDAKRKTDLKNLQAAIELYKNENGQYPAGCNGATTNTTANWSGQPGSGPAYECPSGQQYIVGLAPKYIPTLPMDPKLNPNPVNGTDSGYVYTTNRERSVYKIMALQTVETEEVDDEHPFFRCGTDYQFNYVATDNSWDDVPICRRSHSNAEKTSPQPTIGNPYNQCSGWQHYRYSYALSGGFSSDDWGGIGTLERVLEYDTEIVRCK